MIADKKLVFIGAGNMARAIVRGLLRKSLADPAQILVTDISEAQRISFSEEFGVQAGSDNAGAARQADVLVLAVKPQSFNEVLPGLRNALDPRKTLVISIAAGVRCGQIEHTLGTGVRVVRVMPNMPAFIGRGASAICAGHHAGEADLDLAENLFAATGIVARVTETDMDAVTALSGSGPAYVFYLIEAMLAAADRLGLDEDVATRLALATVKGAAELCESETETPAALRARVSSKGGTTLAALDVFEARGVKKALVEGITAAFERSRQLSGQQDT